jgi:hypothetical protein
MLQSTLNVIKIFCSPCVTFHEVVLSVHLPEVVHPQLAENDVVDCGRHDVLHVLVAGLGEQ